MQTGDAGVPPLAERIATLESELRGLRGKISDDLANLRNDLAELEVEVHGPPREHSLRGRVHTLEQSDAAARAAQAALEAARAVQDRTWSGRRQVIAFTVGLCVSGAAIGGFVLQVIALS